MSVRRDLLNIPELMSHDAYDFIKAKCFASLRWLVSKAFRDQVPANLRNPYYHDHSQGVDRLKPQLVHSLANGELYCSCLVNIYADPNYHNLTHWGVIQTLARRGVYVTEPKDVSLTETVLLQTSPIRMSAHMAVVEALMALYVREVVTPERVVAAIRRFTNVQAPPSTPPAPQQHAILLWLNSSCSALNTAVAASHSAEFTHTRHQQQQDILPSFPFLQEVSDVCDGVCLAGLVAFYAPGVFDWAEIVFSQPARLADSLHNIALVQSFCAISLPHNPLFLTAEDLLYTDSSIIQNILVFLADLFFLFEVKPAKCVRTPMIARDPAFLIRRPSMVGLNDNMSVARSDTNVRAESHSPECGSTVSEPLLLRRNRAEIPSSHPSTSPGVSEGCYNSHVDYSPVGRNAANVPLEKQCGGADEWANHFVVQRANVPPTLSRVSSHGHTESLGADRSMRSSSSPLMESSRRLADKSTAAGKPSVSRAASTGRRSRRNSVSDESQLTLENFGGSQENLHLLSRNPDKQPAVLGHRGCRSNGSATHQDLLNHSSITFDDGGPSFQSELERGVSRSVSQQELGCHEPVPSDTIGSPADNLVIMFDTNEPCDAGGAGEEPQAFHVQPRQTSSFAQLSRAGVQGADSGASTPGINIFYTPQQQKQCQMFDYRLQESSDSHHDQSGRAASVEEVKLRLGEKRRSIENEKRKLENSLDKHKQVLGKQAFLQAVAKNNDVDVEQSGGKWTRYPPDKTVPPDSIDNHGYEHYQNSLQTHPLSELNENIEGLSQQRQLLHFQQYQPFQFNQHIQSQPLETARIAQLPQSLSAAGVYDPVYAGAPHYHRADGSSNLVPADFSEQSQFFLHSQRVGGMPTRRQWLQPVGVGNPPSADLYSQSREAAALAGCSAGGCVYPASLAAVQTRARWAHPDSQRQYQARVYDSELLSPSSVSSAGFDQGAPGGYHTVVNHSAGGHVPDYTDNFVRADYRQPVTQPVSISNDELHQLQPRSSRYCQRRSKEASPDTGHSRSPVLHAPLPVPSLDDMEPQSVCFISDTCSRLNAVSLNEHDSPPPEDSSRILNGSSHRAPNPDDTRPPPAPLQTNPDSAANTADAASNIKVNRLKNGSANSELGFMISFDSDYTPRKSKPKLGCKRNNTSFKSNESKTRKSKGTYQDSNFGKVSSVVPPSSVSPSAFSTYTRSASRQNDLECSPRRTSLSARHVSPLSSTEPPNDIADQPIVAKFEVDDDVRLEDMKPISDDLSSAVGVVIGDQLANPSAKAMDEMERKRERILKMSLKRKEHSETIRREKEEEALKRKEVEAVKEEEKLRKKEAERARKERIFEQYKLKKAIEEAEKNGTAPPVIPAHLAAGLASGACSPAAASTPRSRMRSATARQPRPRSALDPGGSQPRGSPLAAGRSTSNLQSVTETNGLSRWDSQSSVGSDYQRTRRNSNSSFVADGRGDRPVSSHSGRKPPVDRMCSGGRTMRKGESHRTSTGSLSSGRVRSRLGSRTASSASLCDSSEVARHAGFSVHSGRRVSNMDREMNRTFSKASVRPQGGQHQSVASVFGSTGIPRHGHSDSGLGRDAHLRRGASPAGSISGLSYSRRRLDDFSDVSSIASGDYSGPRLFKQPASKSNRSMMLNAVEYCVFPGAVNREAKRRVLEEIAASDAKHFLILFRDGRCQFRALYWYEPETDEIVKLYGTGPRQIDDSMFNRFFKYNSGGKCFSQIHTKHLSATIDAFTIHDQLWQGKRPSVSRKRD